MIESKSSNFAYRLNWLILYYLTVLVELVLVFVSLARSRINDTIRSLYIRPRLKDVAELIESHTLELKKLPNHLAILLNGTNLVFEDLTNIIYWAMSAGVQHLSIYDHQGFLRDQHREFEEYVLSKRVTTGKIVFEAANNNDDNVINNNSDISGLSLSKNGLLGNGKAATNGPMNGFRHSIKIYYIKPEHGKPEIGELCRRFGESIKRGDLAVNAINIDFVDKKLKEYLHSAPDPDLAIYTGDFCCTYGFLPWQIRLTEFIPIGKNVALQDFITVLYKYAKKEQRFGK